MTRPRSVESSDAGLFEPEEVGAAAAPPVAPVADDPDAPLATRMRPRTLDEFVGQQAIVGPGSLLRQAIERDQLRSAIFWGPPGCGKSTLALIIARTTRAAFESYSAVTSGIAEVRQVIERARNRRKLDQRTTLFVDEIHRWNKAQQDALLPHVESGTIALIGATTENPFFEVNAPLISRARVFRFEPLSDEDVRGLLLRAMADTERGLGGRDVGVEPEALEHLVAISGGDARNALNALDAAVQAADVGTRGGRVVTLRVAEEAAQQRARGGVSGSSPRHTGRWARRQRSRSSSGSGRAGARFGARGGGSCVRGGAGRDGRWHRGGRFPVRPRPAATSAYCQTRRVRLSGNRLC